MKRNDFIKTAWLGAYLIPTTIPRFNFDPKQPLDKTLVEEFVGAAHRDKTKVMALLAKHQICSMLPMTGEVEILKQPWVLLLTLDIWSWLLIW